MSLFASLQPKAEMSFAEIVDELRGLREENAALKTQVAMLSKIGGGGRSFVCNEDGTVSPRYAPHLVLGVKLPAAAAASSPRRSSPRRPRPQGKDKSA